MSFLRLKVTKTFTARDIHPRFCKTDVLVAQLKYTKNLYKNSIFRKLMYARKEEFYAPIICFGQFVGFGSKG